MMWRLSAATSILSLASYASASPSHYSRDHLHHLEARNIIYDNAISDSYDFVIVGGGLAGLVLGARLSEDSNTTVLVLEAGDTGDAVADTINHPGNTYWSSLGGTSYDWSFTTTAQAGLANREIHWPRGKVLGGSSATNGMYLVRPSEGEITAWHDLIASDDEEAAKHWTWDSFYATMKATETFGEPTSAIATQADIKYTTASHGTSGPVHHSYPGYTFDLVGQWVPTLEAIGVDGTEDAYGGTNLGAYVANSAINPSNWTRSYSRSAYIDSLPARDNLAILANAQVTKLVWDTSKSGNITATGVEFAASATSETRSVTVNKEVILAGGTVGSPHVLLLSGVGPKDVIESVGLEVVNELPGVGQNLQDHLVAAVVFNTDTETAGAFKAAASAETQTDEFLSYINSATAYINATYLLGSEAASSLKQSMADARQTSSTTLVPSSDDTVRAGYLAVSEATEKLLGDDVAQIEILQSITASGIIMVQAAIQHPLSPGHIYLKSSNAFDAPIIDPGYLAHSADITLMREGLKLARIVGNTPPLSNFITGETAPGTDVNTDEAWEEWMKNNLSTEFHPTGSCAMLPKDKGGVVDAKLKVYGTSNVRVIDASVYPIEFSTHLGAPTYALAETGASIIRSLYNGVAETSSSSGSSTGSNNSASNNSSGGDANNGAAHFGASAFFIGTVAFIMAML